MRARGFEVSISPPEDAADPRSGDGAFAGW